MPPLRTGKIGQQCVLGHTRTVRIGSDNAEIPFSRLPTWSSAQVTGHATRLTTGCRSAGLVPRFNDIHVRNSENGHPQHQGALSAEPRHGRRRDLADLPEAGYETTEPMMRHSPLLVAGFCIKGPNGRGECRTLLNERETIAVTSYVRR